MVIMSDENLGSCWPMEGNQGQLTIQLSQPIHAISIAIEHISRSITADATTAPRDFEVYGANTVEEQFIKLGGPFTYSLDGNTIQFFSLSSFNMSNSSQGISILQIKILSNHGNSAFTCLYRVRVHGTDITAAPSIETYA